MKKTQKIPLETKNKAFTYYCMGLNSHEIGKLLDCSYRTIQNFMSAENWKEKRTNKKQNSTLVIRKAIF